MASKLSSKTRTNYHRGIPEDALDYTEDVVDAVDVTAVQESDVTDTALAIERLEAANADIDESGAEDAEQLLKRVQEVQGTVTVKTSAAKDQRSSLGVSIGSTFMVLFIVLSCFLGIVLAGLVAQIVYLYLMKPKQLKKNEKDLESRPYQDLNQNQMASGRSTYLRQGTTSNSYY